MFNKSKPAKAIFASGILLALMTTLHAAPGAPNGVEKKSDQTVTSQVAVDKAKAVKALKKTQSTAKSKSNAKAKKIKQTPVSDVEQVREEYLMPQSRIEESHTSLDDGHLIKPSSVAAFTKKVLLMGTSQVKSAPVVMASDDSRMYVGPGRNIYVSGFKDADPLGRYGVYRHAGALEDPVSGEQLAEELIHIADVTVLRQGDPALLQIATASQEVSKGDKIFKMDDELTDAIKTIPAPPGFSAQIIRVQNTLASSLMVDLGERLRAYDREAGSMSVVILNKGKTSGIQRGSLVKLMSTTSSKLSSRESAAQSVENGMAMVFKTYDSVAYALVMESMQSVKAKDRVIAP